MRTSHFYDLFAKFSAQFENRNGVEIPARISEPAREYAMIREAAAISDASHMQIFRLPEAGAIDILDPLLAGNVARTRFGRMLHTFLADDDGFLAADCYVANNDTEFLLICESLPDDADIRGFFLQKGASAGMEDITETHALISLDGFKAWAVAKEIFGADILGLPYLSVEMCSFNNTPTHLFRAGKTSEFGYLILIPQQQAQSLAEALLDSTKRHGGGICGSAIHNDLRLEGRFFNIYSEGLRVRDPLPLGLQWMIDFEKPGFRGSDAIHRRRDAGLKSKIIGVQAQPGQALALNDRVFDDGIEKGRIVAACVSFTLGCHIGLALIDVSTAYAGLEFRLNSATGPTLKTISLPPIMPKSLTVKLDEL